MVAAGSGGRRGRRPSWGRGVAIGTWSVQGLPHSFYIFGNNNSIGKKKKKLMVINQYRLKSFCNLEKNIYYVDLNNIFRAHVLLLPQNQNSHWWCWLNSGNYNIAQLSENSTLLFNSAFSQWVIKILKNILIGLRRSNADIWKSNLKIL